MPVEPISSSPGNKAEGSSAQNEVHLKMNSVFIDKPPVSAASLRIDLPGNLKISIGSAPVIVSLCLYPSLMPE